jgi:polyferredoxin
MKRRQKIRVAIIFISLLLFPVTLNYFSPYVIVDGASQGIINGSFIVFAVMFFASLFIGRAWCGWACPAAGLQECCFPIRGKRARGGRFDWIKWFIWVPWVGIILILGLSAGYDTVNVLYLTEKVVSVDEAAKYVTYYAVIGIFLILALTAGKRAGCHYICWMAPFMIIGRKIRNIFKWPALRLTVDSEKCISCMTCTKNCPMSLHVNDMVQKASMENAECILCGTCVDGCPENVITYSFSKGE